MTNFYTGVLAVTVSALFVMSLLAGNNAILPRSRKWRFIISYILIATGALAEWGAMYLQVHSSMVWLHIIVKSIDLIVAPAIPIAILPTISKSRRIMLFMVVVVIVNAVLIVLSSFMGFIFSVDAENVYHHEKLYFLYMVSYFLVSLLLLFATMSTMRTFQSTSTWLIGMIMVFMLFGLTLQIIDSSIRVDYITITIAVLFLYNTYEDVLQSSDSLTRLLNRHTYDTRITNLDSVVTIINIDIDYFKQCNDTYGHLFGDEVLQTVARIIRESFDRRARCYRTGGDEFCVIIKGEVGNPELLMEKLHSNMEKGRQEMPRLPFISTGFAIFYPEKESLIDAIEAADSMMYKYKNLRKKLWKEGRELPYHEIQEILNSKSIYEVR